MRMRGGLPMAAQVVPLALIVVAEAAWLAILGGLVDEYTLRSPGLDVVELAGVVLAGAIAARVARPRLGPSRWAPTAVILVAGAAAAGVLVAPEARAALAAPGGGIGEAVVRNPGGLVAGLAVLRGFRHSRLPLDEDALRHLLAGGMAVAVFGALAGSLIAEPWRGQFLTAALAWTVIFSTTAVLGLALTRHVIAEMDSGEGWTPNASWIGLLVVTLAITGLAVVPAATIVSPVIELVAYLLLVALFLVGAVFGWTRRTALGLLISIVILATFSALLSLVPDQSTASGGGGGGGGGAGAPGVPSPLPPDALASVAPLGWIAAALAVLVVAILAWRWAQDRRDPGQGVVAETRFIDRSRGTETPASRPGWRARLGLRRSPNDATTAYLELIRDLAAKPGVERIPSETPREHAHRLRTSGSPTFALELLAADYALARFAGLPVTPRENRRAIARWRDLRVRLDARSRELAMRAEAIEVEAVRQGPRADRAAGRGEQPGDLPPPAVSPRG